GVLYVVGVPAALHYLFGAHSWFPPAVSKHGLAFDDHFARTLAVCGLAFAAAQFALGWVLVRRTAPRTTGRAEWAVMTAIAAAFCVRGGASAPIFPRVQFAPPNPDAMRVEVLSRQFAWNFRYPGPDGRFGRADLKLVNDAGGNPFGLDRRDPAA